MTSPYFDKSESAWPGITRRLVRNHPLTPSLLLETATKTWTTLWQTTIGTGATAVHLSDLRVPATVVGYFFEVLFCRELERREPNLWRGSQSKDEKDLVK
ncbi:MAG: ScaI family restriction endonuclease [Pirellulales bacterium]|nr:ScaI family restriction endonuclease [Pirellulales bacterium]